MAKNGTVVLPCTCKDEFQDMHYGKEMRLHNLSGKDNLAFCTVCSPNNSVRKLIQPAPLKKGKPFKA